MVLELFAVVPVRFMLWPGRVIVSDTLFPLSCPCTEPTPPQSAWPETICPEERKLPLTLLPDWRRKPDSVPEEVKLDRVICQFPERPFPLVAGVVVPQLARMIANNTAAAASALMQRCEVLRPRTR
jgi:hypothetical protein